MRYMKEQMCLYPSKSKFICVMIKHQFPVNIATYEPPTVYKRGKTHMHQGGNTGY